MFPPLIHHILIISLTKPTLVNTANDDPKLQT